MKEDLINFSARINRKVAEDWYKTVNFNKELRHPVRIRLEEALLDNIKKNQERKKAL